MIKKLLLVVTIVFISITSNAQSTEISLNYGTNQSFMFNVNRYVEETSKITSYIGVGIGFSTANLNKIIYSSSDTKALAVNYGVKINRIKLGVKSGICYTENILINEHKPTKPYGTYLIGFESGISLTKELGLNFGYNNIMGNTFGINFFIN